MPGEFLTNEQRESYGKFSDELTDEQIAKYFMLDDKDKIFTQVSHIENSTFEEYTKHLYLTDKACLDTYAKYIIF